MADYILDTTTLTHLRRQHVRVVANVAAHAGDRLSIATINVEETLGGWYRQLRAARTNAQRSLAYEYLGLSTKFLAAFPFVHPTESALDRADRLLKQRLNVGRGDLTVAAIALEIGATVVTNNLRDFRRVPGLLVEDWTI